MKLGKRVSTIYNDISLRRKLTIVFTVFISALIITIGAFTYRISVNNLETSEKRLLTGNLELKGEIFNTYFLNIQRKVDQLFNNELIQQALQEDYSDYTISQLLATLDTLYKIMTPISDDIAFLNSGNRYKENSGVRIKLYPLNDTIPIDGGLVHAFSTIAEEPWVSRMLNYPNRAYWVSGIVDYDDVRHITVNRVMLDFSTFKQLGIISIMIPEINIIDMLQKAPNSSSELQIKTDEGLYQHPSAEYAVTEDELDKKYDVHIGKE